MNCRRAWESWRRLGKLYAFVLGKNAEATTFIRVLPCMIWTFLGSLLTSTDITVTTAPVSGRVTLIGGLKKIFPFPCLVIRRLTSSRPMPPATARAIIFRQRGFFFLRLSELAGSWSVALTDSAVCRSIFSSFCSCMSGWYNVQMNKKQIQHH